jgi:hypothetical protein
VRLNEILKSGRSSAIQWPQRSITPPRTGVDPVWWTVFAEKGRGPQCQERIHRTRRNIDDGWSNWFEQSAR